MASFKSKILEIVDETPRVKLFRLERPADFVFSPGQFIMASIEGLYTRENILVKRSYSIASSPSDNDFLELCVSRADNGLFSGALHNLKKGDYVNIQGPYGVFSLRRPVPENVTFIAGGSGIAPIRSMLRSLLMEKDAPSKIRLFYGFRAPSDFIYRKELQEFSKRLIIAAAIDSPAEGWNGEVGFISDVIQRHVNYERSDSYVCGPPPMVNATIKSLISLGFDERRIYREQW